MCYYIEKVTEKRLRYKVVQHVKTYGFCNREYNQEKKFGEKNIISYNEIKQDLENMEKLCKILSVYNITKNINILENIGEWQYITFDQSSSSSFKKINIYEKCIHEHFNGTSIENI